MNSKQLMLVAGPQKEFAMLYKDSTMPCRDRIRMRMRMHHTQSKIQVCKAVCLAHDAAEGRGLVAFYTSCSFVSRQDCIHGSVK